MFLDFNGEIGLLIRELDMLLAFLRLSDLYMKLTLEPKKYHLDF